MGHEIYYCSVCRQQIRSADLDSGQAFQLENRHFCLNCGPELLRTLPKDKVKDIFKSISTPAKPFPAAEPSPTPRPTPRPARLRRASSSPVVPAAVGAAVVVVAIGAWLLSSGGPEPDPTPPPAPVVRPAVRPTPPPAAPPERTPEPVRVAPTPAPDKERVAREALQKAREWAAANPSDFDGAVRKFQDAGFLATGTSLQAEAGKDLETYRQKQRNFFAGELSSVEPEVKAACAQERFMKALDLLRLAKDRYGSAEWHLLVGKRVREVNDGAFQLFNRVKEEALDARNRGDEDKVKALRDRVASWGVERFSKELSAALDK